MSIDRNSAMPLSVMAKYLTSLLSPFVPMSETQAPDVRVPPTVTRTSKLHPPVVGSGSPKLLEEMSP